MRKKRHEEHEEHVDESWLIPYADMLTLLLALFIVLFAASTVDVKKYEAITKSFEEVLNGGTGIMESEPSTMQPQEGSFVGLEEDPEEDKEEEKEKQEQEESEEELEKDLNKLEKLKDRIDAYIGKQDLDAFLQTKLTEEGLLITIKEAALFQSGKANLTGDAKELAKEISSLLVTDPPRRITVTGHTDNRPIKTSQYQSNWHLSSERALNFMTELLKNKNLKPELYSFTGYGEYRPIDTNKTDAGRAKNRRVEVLILPYNVEN
ncbi:flagellar motor protein MotB [Alkalihalobacillus macyae]|uniref:flagellar motor protein MotB n=1 Tax=Guptibacillus hwajinpoensis TaxID=208199 RepID=UPI00273C0B3B|nr:flagellar motor protein MotB [Alkalihalobacillus macyae]MDP4551452.1 flagellar motor protein MotB [Alkalihalobacillus macyae]